MATLGQKILRAIVGKKKEVKIVLDPKSVEDNTTINALSRKNAELEAFRAKVLAQEGKSRERDKDKKEEDEVKIFLNKEKKEIQTKSYPKYFSLKRLFSKMSIEQKKKKGKRFWLTSFDRAKKLAKFGDIGFSSDGDIVVLSDNNDVVLKMKNLNDIFQSVNGLGTDAENYILPVNLDQEGAWFENIMTYEASELIPTEDGRLRYSKARKRPVYELLREKAEQMGELSQQLEASEKERTELQNKIDEITRANKILENSRQTTATEFSKSEMKVSAVERVIGDIEKETIALRNQREVNEEDIEKLNREVETLRAEAERQGIKLSDAKALELVLNIKRELVKDMPPQEEKEEKPVTSPAQTQQSSK